MKKSIRKGICVIASAVLAFSMMPAVVHAEPSNAVVTDVNTEQPDQNAVEQNAPQEAPQGAQQAVPAEANTNNLTEASSVASETTNGDGNTVPAEEASSAVEAEASSVAEAEASSAAAAAEQSSQAAQTTYSGLSMDGDFSDWDAVSKTTPSDNRVKEVASVWDGDYLYIYAESGDWGSITWSGPNGNGKFAIKSDLGYTVLLQFKKDGDGYTVEGPEGTTYYVNGNQWEVAIPKSALPNYVKSLDVGFYLGDTLVDGIQNLDGSTNENIARGEMALDGSYSEWEQYPHTVIQYNTAGTSAMVADAHGAMYMDGEKIYGHVVTNLPEHTQRAGGEFSYGVMMFNSANPSTDWGNQQQFGWKLFTLDDNGNVINANVNNLSPGTHRFYVTNVSSGASRVDDPYNKLYIFGEMVITVGQGDSDNMEFCLDTKEIADYFKLSAGDLRIASVHYTGIGNEWVTVAGTSSGPVLGVILSMAVAGAALIYKRKRMDGAVECVGA